MPDAAAAGVGNVGHLGAVGGDDELDVGEGFPQLSDHCLLPAGVQVHVDLVDLHHAGRFQSGPAARLRVQFDAVVGQVADQLGDTLRGDAQVMAQVQNNSLDQAMKAKLPAATVAAIMEAMPGQPELAGILMSNELARELFYSVVYEMLKKNVGADLLASVRGEG